MELGEDEEASAILHIPPQAVTGATKSLKGSHGGLNIWTFYRQQTAIPCQGVQGTLHLTVLFQPQPLPSSAVPQTNRTSNPRENSTFPKHPLMNFYTHFISFSSAATILRFCCEWTIQRSENGAIWYAAASFPKALLLLFQQFDRDCPHLVLHPPMSVHCDRPPPRGEPMGERIHHRPSSGTIMWLPLW